MMTMMLALTLTVSFGSMYTSICSPLSTSLITSLSLHGLGNYIQSKDLRLYANNKLKTLQQSLPDQINMSSIEYARKLLTTTK